MATVLESSGFKYQITILALLAITLSLTIGLSSNESAVKNANEDTDKKPVPVFAEYEQSKVASRIYINQGKTKIVGWIAGDKSFNGKTVSISAKGLDKSVTVDANNCFVWKHGRMQNVPVTFSVGDLKKKVTLVADYHPSGNRFAYFVVDRTAYRPNQTLKFVCFLRKNDFGTFKPINNQSVSIEIRSTKKNTKATTIRGISDDFGRVEGEYTFTSADSLDDYRLSVSGFEGTTTIKLAEFRKAKVKLNIDTKIVDRKLKVNFQAVDFLENPVAGSNVSFEAKVTYNGNYSQTEKTLNADQFAMSSHSRPAKTKTLTDAHPDEKLLKKAGLVTTQSYIYSLPVAAAIEGEVEISDDGSGEYIIPLKRSWTQGGYSIDIKAVLLDYNGREQRASKNISLGGKVHDCDLVLKLPKEIYQTGETVNLKIEPTQDGEPVQVTGSIVVMRLSPKAPSIPSGFDGYGYGYGAYGSAFGYRNSLYSGRYSSRIKVNKDFDFNEATKRTLIDTELIDENAAKIELDEPGAYKLICMAKLPNGRELRNEIGCVVLAKDELPKLVIKLDKQEFNSDETLTGWIHSRVKDAKALLTLRDSSGIRHHETIQFENGIARIDWDFPTNMRYGFTVEALLSQKNRTYSAIEFARVVPLDRIVDLEVKHNEVYQPGEEIELEIAASSKQQMDLVVSVYDQSLLGIAADKSIDVKNYFLADERVAYRRTNDDLETYLDGITFKELVEKARKYIESNPLPDNRFYQMRQVVQNYDRLINSNSYGYCYGRDIPPLLEFAGFDVEGGNTLLGAYGYDWWFKFTKDREDEDPVSLFQVLSGSPGDGNGRINAEINVWLKNETIVFDYNRQVYANPSNQWQFGMQQGYGYGGRARGDARYSISGNSFLSNMGGASGQALFSAPVVMPNAGAAEQFGSNSDVTVRRDFSDAAYWNAKVRTDKNGKATVKFKLPDSLTNWQVSVVAVTPEMKVGQTTAKFRTFKPVMVWPMLPRTFTEGDVVSIYASVHNRTKVRQEMTVKLEAENGEILDDAMRTITLEPESNLPVYWRFQTTSPGFTQILMTAKCKAGSDASLKRLPVAPLAATQFVTASGFASQNAMIGVPDDVNLTDATCEVTLVPSLIDDAMDSLDYLVQYPHGCVEQTMSRFLPAIKVKGVLDKSGIKNKGLEERLPKVVDAGIKRLLELQKSDGGWGWHSSSQTHEMMTPYALYGLIEAEKAGYEIPNQSAVNSGVQRLQSYINQMRQDSQTADRMYCMYVFSQKHNLDVNRLDWISVLVDGKLANSQIPKNKDRKIGYVGYSKLRGYKPLSDYALALALEIAVQAKQNDLAARIVSQLRSRAKGGKHTAHWETARFSRWRDDPFEITAAVLKALVAYDVNDPLIPKILAHFSQTKRGKQWNSTKDTAMILYAICDYLNTQSYEPGQVRNFDVIVGNWSKSVEVNPNKITKVSVPTEKLQKGENKILFDGANAGMMYRAVLQYVQQGDSIKAAAEGVEITRKYFLLDEEGKKVRELTSGDKIPRGSYLLSEVTATHLEQNEMTYVLIENPKPSCCEILPKEDRRFNANSTRFALREDKTFGVAYHHERTPKTLIDRCVLHAELAGEYFVAPARVELMYNTLEHGHTEAFKLQVSDESEKDASKAGVRSQKHSQIQ